jgi:3-oxoadipate enol-lactonase
MPLVETSIATRLGYDESGTGDRLPIIFLHGIGSDRTVWRPQLNHFSGERRSVAFDYPGYGLSDAAPDGTTRDDYASAILSAMRNLGIERAHICGLSLGGVVAIAMAHADADACASLILADTFAVHPDGQAIYDRSVAASSDLRVLAEARVDVLMAQPADPAVRREVIETMAAISPDAYRIGAEAVWLADQRERVHAIRTPTLVMCGSEDKITTPALSRELAKLIPGARLELVEGAGHLANIERPDAFNTLVGAFIRGVDSHG